MPPSASHSSDASASSPSGNASSRAADTPSHASAPESAPSSSSAQAAARSSAATRIHHSEVAPDLELRLHDLHPAPDDMRGDIVSGLTGSPKTLPCKYFYDERGSALFDEICELDEYYPTRTETAILEEHVGDMAAAMGKGALVIELGSGSSTKTPLLLDALDDPAGYVPIDISREHLLGAAERIRETFPSMPVWPVCADFTAPLSLPPVEVAVHRRFVFFPGSTMGNFDAAGRRKLLHRIASLCQPEGGGLLIGLDLLKDRPTLEAAYNDARGVTADFNLNLLERINRELDSDFDPGAFEHDAPFNEEEGRIEMHLVSRADQTVFIGDTRIDFAEGERICTEHSYKFSLDEFGALAAEAGLYLRSVWTDEDELFAVALFETSRG
jgi:dimethylhistidine N-methyltransferase